MHVQDACRLKTTSHCHDFAGFVGDKGVLDGVKPFVALGMLVLHAIASIDGVYVDCNIKLGVCQVVGIKEDVALERGEDTRRVLACKFDRVAICNFPLQGIVGGQAP